MLNKILFGLVKDTASRVLEHQKNNAVDNLVNVFNDAISDTIHSMIAKKETLQEWAETVTSSIDAVIERTVIEKRYQYVGGKLKFAYSQKNASKIDISFELFFLDDEEHWHKVASKSDVYDSTFTVDALEELRNKGTIEYEIKG